MTDAEKTSGGGRLKWGELGAGPAKHSASLVRYVYWQERGVCPSWHHNARPLVIRLIGKTRYELRAQHQPERRWQPD